MALQLANLGLGKSIGLLGVKCLSIPNMISGLVGSDSCLLLGGVRNKHSKKVNWDSHAVKNDPEGVHYHGFTYFPRPNQVDPPIEPTKLFMVKRVASLSGCPRWEKLWIRDLGLEARRATAIIKNTPENNKKLYRVKHLIQIIPIKTPQGLPDKPENGFLKENGEFICHNLLAEHGPDMTTEAAEEEYKKYYDKNMDGLTLKTRLHLRWYSRFDIVT